MKESVTLPLVSIICNAYNHEPYIRDALEGFVTQKTDFPFEVLIHDDASTDKTADIIREYEARYPHIIKPVYQTENQYSKNGISQFQYPRAKGKYIAFCEGDDYWTDPLKLQKQFAAMEAHPEVDICAHAALAVTSADKTGLYPIAPLEQDGILTAEQVITGGGGYVATNSLFYRRELIENPPAFRRFLRLDYTLQIQGALRGGMLYLSDCMSSYRVQSVGSWTEQTQKNASIRLAHNKKILEMLKLLDEETDGRYRAAIVHIRLPYEFRIFLQEEQYRVLLQKKYREQLRALTSKERLKIRIKAAFPFLYKVKRALTK